MMLNVRGKFCCIIGILFVLSIAPTALGQQSDSALTQSQFEKILEKIEESEKETRAYIDQKFDKLDTKIDEKFGELDKKIDGLEAKFHELDKRVNRIDLKVNILIGILTIIGGPILVQILNHAVRNRLNSQNKDKIVAEVAAENRDESDEDIRRRNLRDRDPSEAA
ncbi:MAG: hypothetical protein OXM61_02820 [Candidatus Poribacteria bacterium]|nr:hypothetical protein [Candidatus Poribacteria bacterium]